MKLSVQILLAFLIIIILSVIDSSTNYFLSVEVKQNTEFLNKSEAIIRNSSNLHKTIIEMQNNSRGFLLTADTNFLSSYDWGIKKVPSLFMEQKEFLKEDKSQLALLDSINRLHEQWVYHANSLINAKKKVDTSKASNALYNRLFETILKKKIGKKINDEITVKFLDFDKREYKLRSVHNSNLISSIERTHTISLFFIALIILIGISSTLYIVKLISKRIRTMVHLAEVISKGNFTTVKDTHNDELSRLSDSLNIMSGNLKKNISELEKRNAELDKFAYVVSHDLKAPIRGIHNVIKWIEEDFGNEVSPEMKKYLRIIPQRTKRMEDLINGLLDYARIREKTTLEKIDVNKLVKDIAEAIVPRHFKIEINTLPIIYTERLKLEQVFSNLISNSVKYTVHKKGKIVIGCEEQIYLYEFSVKDNGIGIEPEYHEKIFEIFQTLREKDEKESTGIGLAIVKKIIDEQHGTINVKSKLGEGAEFIFTWPKSS